MCLEFCAKSKLKTNTVNSFLENIYAPYHIYVGKVTTHLPELSVFKETSLISPREGCVWMWGWWKKGAYIAVEFIALLSKIKRCYVSFLHNISLKDSHDILCHYFLCQKEESRFSFIGLYKLAFSAEGSSRVYVEIHETLKIYSTRLPILPCLFVLVLGRRQVKYHTRHLHDGAMYYIQCWKV